MAAVTALLGFASWTWRGAELDRLAPRAQTVGTVPAFAQPASGASWCWVGSFVPAAPKDLPRLKRRLIRAGFRNPRRRAHLPRHPRRFDGCLRPGALVGGWHPHSPTRPESAVLTGGGAVRGLHGAHAIPAVAHPRGASAPSKGASQRARPDGGVRGSRPGARPDHPASGQRAADPPTPRSARSSR